MLMNRQQGHFSLKIDSILAEAYNEESMLQYANERPELDAPYNSMDSDDNFNIYDSSSDEDFRDAQDNPLKGVTADDPKWFDVRILDISPFRMEAMKYFPYKSREGDIPLKLLKD